MRRREKIIKGVFEVEQRFQTHISTDKPLYKLNDTVYVRGILLSPHKQKPIPDSLLKNSEFYLGATFQILGPKGDVIVSNEINSWNHSVLSAHWEIPESQTGGEYVAKFTYKGNGLPSAERKFEIRAFQNPRLNSQIQFVRKGMGAGDKAVATLKVDRAEGGPCNDAKVTVKARVDGQEVYSGITKLDTNGTCIIGFDIPKVLTEGEGTLTCVIEDQGVVETATKTIPILMNHIDVKVYPEGGDLVEGLESGLYLEAFTKQGEPADLIGVIVDIDGKIVANLNTVHEGRGKTVFTPTKGNKYCINVIKPSGIKEIPIPQAKSEGCTLMSTSNIYECDDALSFKFSATKSGKYLITIYKKELQLTRVNVKVAEDNSQVPVVLTLPTDVNADGVLRVTVTDSSNNPVAERLIFRRQTNKVNVKVVTDYKSFTPGDKVKLRIQTTDDEGKPISSNVCVCVTDESVLEIVERRKHHPRLDTMVYLENEVDHLDDATIYLSDDPIAQKATDLLLGTQGWRRFAYVDIMKFISEKKEKGEKIACVHEGFEKPVNTYEDGFYTDKPSKQQQQPKGFYNSSRRDRIDNSYEEDEEYESNSLDDLLGGYDSKISYSSAPSQPKSVKTSAGFFSGLTNIFGGKKESEEVYKSAPTIEKFMAPSSFGEKSEKKKRKEDTQFSAPRSRNLTPKKVSQVVSEKEVQMDIVRPQLKVEAQKPTISQSPQIFSLDDYDSLFSLTSHQQSNLKPQSTQLLIREYAHKISSDRKPGSRVDFTETLYWNAVTQTDENGRAIFEFDLSDSITSFRAYVDAFTNTGVIGYGTKLLSSKEPFYMEPILPIEVSSGDIVKMPVALINSSTNDLDVKVSHKIESKLVEPKSNKLFEGKSMEIESGQKKRIILEMNVNEGFGRPMIELSGDAGAFSDKVTRNFSVVPSGFPNKFSTGSLISSDDPLSLIVPIAEDAIQSSIKSTISFFSSPLSNISSGLQSLLKEPHGCFEQVSSTTYPTVMAHQYFSRHQDLIDPSLISKSSSLIEKGYKKLITYECKDGGFEWFANGSGHEGLTALGVLEFSEMKKIYPVDELMLKRTTDWLLERRDGKGSFVPNKAKSYQFGGYAKEHIKVAYIVWALSEAGLSKELSTEINAVYVDNKESKEPYTMALCGNSLYNAGMNKEGLEISQKLSKLQHKNGFMNCDANAHGMTITGSRGQSCLIETTALAILCWMNDYSTFTKEIENAMRWLHSTCNDGRYGSTQATCLALKAILKYEETVPKKSERNGVATVIIDSEHQFDVPILATSTEAAQLDISNYLTKHGDHTIDVKLSNGISVPYSLTVDYYSKKPEDSSEAEIDLTTKLSQTKFTEGEGGEINVELINTSDSKQGMSMALVGLPGGLEPRHEQLKELVKQEIIDCYEIIGRTIAIYKKALDAKETLKFKIDVVARVPGEYKAPASRSYLYYNDEHKKWIDGLSCEILPL